ncbi:hypothetical protein Adt_10291 [Abeliophyllum distichum]|uniref:Uncharacterized protein n=1 Tax=Abeliophyllum distichum TaxID=126358 RepID=A0ABD1UJK5_9LAMI
MSDSFNPAPIGHDPIAPLLDPDSNEGRPPSVTLTTILVGLMPTQIGPAPKNSTTSAADLCLTPSAVATYSTGRVTTGQLPVSSPTKGDQFDVSIGALRFAPAKLPSDSLRGATHAHFDNSVNAVSFKFVAISILISMFLVMAIFE